MHEIEEKNPWPVSLKLWWPRGRCNRRQGGKKQEEADGAWTKEGNASLESLFREYILQIADHKREGSATLTDKLTVKYIFCAFPKNTTGK